MFPSVLLLFAVVTAAPPAAGSIAKEDAKAKVTQAMRLNFGALMTLQPLVASPARFADPANAITVRDQLDILQRTPHVFAAGTLKGEPGLAAVAHLFRDYLRTVRRHFESGQVDLARGQLRTLSEFCFSCHTRLPESADFQDLDKQVTTLGLSPLEDADLTAATRQFDLALEKYRRALKQDVEGEAANFAWLRSARYALRLTVRVKHNLDAAEKIVQALEARPHVPDDVKDTVLAWRRDLTVWKADPFQPATASPQALVTKARELIGRADGWLFSELPDIPLLRATGYLHEALARAPNGAQRPEALFLLGLAASGPFDPFLWDMGHLYFQACIEENPRTPIARRCFQRLQNDIYFGFTGSSGTHIPADEAARLAALRKLAY